MLRCIKMDLYRMFHTKALYIIWIIMAAGVIFSTYMTKIDEENIRNESSAVEFEQEAVSVGMQVTLNIEEGQSVTVDDQVYANLKGTFVTLFLAIFTVIFSTADINSGYIKNVGGQVKRRESLILSKTVSLFIFTAITMALYFIFQILFQRIFFGNMIFRDAGSLLRYFVVHILLNYAMVLVCMAFSIIFKHNTISMTLSICLIMKLQVIIYSFIDKIIEKMGVADFQLIEHTVIGKMSLLSLNSDNRQMLFACLTAVIFGAASALITCLVFKRRDIV